MAVLKPHNKHNDNIALCNNIVIECLPRTVAHVQLFCKHSGLIKNEDCMDDCEVLEDNSIQGYSLVKKPNTTSKVWLHFRLKGHENGTPFPAEIDKPIF